ncbi:Activating signal cointegrator 1 complex subunit 2 [Purpureocillium lavendulum]|uniref:Activating signal cointegrator 1 complex subunit 2 n=1 Tax=Purpureocillium lavendulum TaxID=1247861 RepID=A0AB34FPG7_9HYPO|nr:Activating signal cointegrator 1 complex subunit 2 [Purpureocillium lavendulum]
MVFTGDKDCFGCQSRFQERWCSVAQLERLAEEGCSYCSLLHKGLHELDPDIKERLGHDAQIRFKRSPDEMHVYNDPNGSLGHRPDLEAVDLQFEYYSESDKRNYYQPTGDTSSDISYGRAYWWVDNCTKQHKLCGAGEPTQLPTRIIDLGVKDAKEPLTRVWLREPPRDLKARYAALSHCWGGDIPLKTTTATFDQHTAGIEFSQLPQTFQDAANIVRRLGVRYLWIDSLCIIQDSTEDWQVEASRMASVYRNSWLTVSASSSPSSSSGCYRRGQAVNVEAAAPDEDDPLAVLFPAATKLRKDLRLNLRFKFLHPSFGHERFPDSEANKPFPLLNRAWAYQERFLAPRVLHFGTQEVFWECMQDLICECGAANWANGKNMGGYMNRDTSGDLPPKISHCAAMYVGKSKEQALDAKKESKLLERWAEMVGEYTERELTYPMDRLPAISGLAGEMAEALRMKYCAGLWEETLPLGLLWQRANVFADPGPRSQPPIAPSWSWAAINGPVKILVPLKGPRRNPEFTETYAKVEEVCCIPVGKDERGQVCTEKSHITLSAELVEVPLGLPGSGRRSWFPIKKAIAKGAKPERGSLAVKNGDGEVVRFDPDYQLCDNSGVWHWGEDEILYLAKIAKSSGDYYWLALRRAEEESTYERVGVIENSDAQWESDGVQRQLRIR